MVDVGLFVVVVGGLSVVVVGFSIVIGVGGGSSITDSSK
jgi:hypothetical protein